MGVVIVRPNQTSNLNNLDRTGGTSSLSVMSDGSDATYLTATGASTLDVNRNTAFPVTAGKQLVGVSMGLRLSTAFHAQTAQLCIDSVPVNCSRTVAKSVETTTLQSSVWPKSKPFTKASILTKGGSGAILYDMWFNAYEIDYPTATFDIPSLATAPIDKSAVTLSAANDTGLTLELAIYYSVHLETEDVGGFQPTLDKVAKGTLGNGALSVDVEIDLMPMTATLGYRLYYRIATIYKGVIVEKTSTDYLDYSASSGMLAPYRPTMTGAVGSDYSVAITANLQQRSGLTNTEVLVWRSASATQGWKEVKRTQIAPTDTAVTFDDIGYDPQEIAYYKCALDAIYDATGATVRSTESFLWQIGPLDTENRVIKTEAASLFPAIITGWDDGDFADDASVKWPIGASSPVIVTSAKRLEAGSFECLVEGADIPIARSIAKYIGDVYIITPLGECKKVRLSNTKVALRGDVAGTKYKFSASWQEID